MNIDNVRELKASVLGNITKAIHSASVVRSLGVQTQAMSPSKGALRGIAVGISRVGKEHRLALRVQRRLLEDGALLEKIERRAKGEVDVRYVGRIQKLETPAALQKRRRGLVIGCSIGHFKITAGTLGCFVTEQATGAKLILSNNHVLANENDAKSGDAILQPGKIDGGKKTTDAIGTLQAFEPLKKSGVNIVDCAIASIKPKIQFQPNKLGRFGVLTGVSPVPVVDKLKVQKVGRTTGETKGRVTAFELDNVVVGYDLGNLRFDDQIEIEGAGPRPFSAGGDSGSLIVDEDLAAVGLLFAGGDQGGSNGMGLTYANPIQRVLDTLKVDLLF